MNQPDDSGSITVKRLLRMNLPKTKFFVSRLLPEGLTLLVAPGKVGKSFLVTSIATSIARGEPALGRIPTEKSEILYLDLENNEAKAQERWRMQLKGAEPPDGIHLFFSWPDMDHGGLEKIGKFLDDEPQIGVVFVDVFTKIKPSSAQKGGGNSYDHEYKILSRLKEFADKRRIAVCCVHHTNRMNPEDPLSSISGTNAMGGAPDAIWILSRDRTAAFGKLYVTGRVAYESQFHMVWVKETGIWEIASQES